MTEEVTREIELYTPGDFDDEDTELRFEVLPDERPDCYEVEFTHSRPHARLSMPPVETSGSAFVFLPDHKLRLKGRLRDTCVAVVQGAYKLVPEPDFE